MIIADWIIIALLALFCVIGFVVGFGKGLYFFTGGIFGALIAVIVCYCVGGLIYEISFVQTLINMLVDALTDKNGFFDFLLSIHFEIIAYYIVLFIIVLLIRLIIVRTIRRISEVDNVLLKLINKIFGMALFAVAFAFIALIAFQVIQIIGGGTEESIKSMLAGSALRLDWVYENNPLMAIVKVFVIRIEG